MQVVESLLELHPQPDLVFVLENILGKIITHHRAFFLLLSQLHPLCFHGILNGLQLIPEA
jgi:hypothetical protein